MLPSSADIPHFLVHLLLCALAAGLLAWSLPRRLTWRQLAFGCAVVVAFGLGLGLVTAPGGEHFSAFALLLTWAWTGFIVAPAVLLGAALRLFVTRQRMAGGAFVAASVVLIGVAVDAFVIEPHALAVTRYSATSARIAAPLRVAVIADLQTDAPGAYEAGALRAVMAEAPDLIVFPGDMIQQSDPAAYERAWSALTRIVAAEGLTAPLGVWATRGDCDPADRWASHLSGVGMVRLDGAEAIRADVTLVGLDLAPSSVPLTRTRRDETFTIVVGHRPDFALGQVDADLLLAGHTHGGQVRVPWFGPLVTASNVPRAWAEGRTTIDADTTLIVSRGVGMERADAPRLRFACPPEIVIVDVLPAA